MRVLLAALGGFALGLILSLLLSGAAALALLVGLLFVSAVLFAKRSMAFGFGTLSAALAMALKLLIM